MNLKSKRLVRTPYSEQYALFDLDRTDSAYNPLSVGKLDLHYTEQGIYGTLLFWRDPAEGMAWEHLVRRAEALLSEFNEPMGVPVQYAIELFAPSLQQYELLSNISPETNADEDRSTVTGEAVEIEAEASRRQRVEVES